MPPSGAQISTYLHCSGCVADRSLGVRSWVNRPASGPVISTCRSTATSHSVTPLTRYQYSFTSSS